MNHYLITRFNLRTKDWSLTRKGTDVLTDSWLKDRFKLFESYCLPSVSQQSNPDFFWCVFFDSETPTEYKKRIDNIAKRQSNFIPIYIGDMAYLNQALIDFIEKSKNKKYPFVITTRLDNDDIIHKDFIEVIQKNFSLKEDMVIDLRKGYQINLGKKNSEIRKIDFPFNQFISFVESSSATVKTVMSKQHQEWKRHSKVMVYNRKEMWVELIHDTNKLNDVRFQFKRTVAFDNDEFGIKPTFYVKENRIQVISNNLKLDIKHFITKLTKKLGK
jgi:hypothetical protein